MDTDKDIILERYGLDKSQKGIDRADVFLRNFIMEEGWRAKGGDADDDHYLKYQEKREKVD